MQTAKLDWKTVRRHVQKSNAPAEIKGLLTAFFEAGDWDICTDGESWIRVKPFEPTLSGIEMLTDVKFKSFTIRLPVEQRPFSGPPYGYCAVDINTETDEVYLKCLASWYPSSMKLDLDAKLLARYIIDRIRSKLMYFLEKLPE
jgi:hypothetical protein